MVVCVEVVLRLCDLHRAQGRGDGGSSDRSCPSGLTSATGRLALLEIDRFLALRATDVASLLACLGRTLLIGLVSHCMGLWRRCWALPCPRLSSRCSRRLASSLLLDTWRPRRRARDGFRAALTRREASRVLDLLARRLRLARCLLLQLRLTH